MEEALRAKLLATAAITGPVADRVDWGLRPQGDPLPGLTLQTVGGTRGMTLTGADGWRQVRVQVDAWAKTFKQARDLRDACATLFAGLRVTSSTSKLRTFVLDERGDPEGGAQGDPDFRASLDIMVHWSGTA